MTQADPRIEARERLEADLRTRNLYDEDGFIVLKVREADLRTILSALSEAERALNEYHASLCRREHGGLAAGQLADALERVFGRTFDQYRAALSPTRRTGDA